MAPFQIAHKEITLQTVLVDALFQQTRYLTALAQEPNMLDDDKSLAPSEIRSRINLHMLIAALVCDVLASRTTLSQAINSLYDLHAEICDTLRLDGDRLKDRARSEYEIKRCILRATLNDLLAIAGLNPLH